MGVMIRPVSVYESYMTTKSMQPGADAVNAAEAPDNSSVLHALGMLLVALAGAEGDAAKDNLRRKLSRSAGAEHPAAHNYAL